MQEKNMGHICPIGRSGVELIVNVLTVENSSHVPYSFHQVH